MKKSIKWDKKKILTALLVVVAWLTLTIFFPDLTGADETGDTQQTVGTTEGVTEEQTRPPTEGVTDDSTEASTEVSTEALLDRDGTYTSKEDVALYLYLYGELPDNFITKSEAEALGWEGGSVERYAPGKCIGGDRFGNREGLLPKASGRQYYECDIDTLGENSRGAKRIVFSNDGLVYYTDDHYETFELLYTKEGPQ